jgi:hypothetical protein
MDRIVIVVVVLSKDSVIETLNATLIFVGIVLSLLRKKTERILNLIDIYILKFY